MSERWWSNTSASWLAVIYVAAIIGQLFVTGRAGELFNPSSILLESNKGDDIFAGRLNRGENSAFVVLGYMKLLCIPFFYIELQRKLGSRWILQLLLLCGVTYLQVTVAEQWGRAALVQPFLIWLFVLLAHKRISGKIFTAIIVMGFTAVVPILNSITVWRQGGDFALTDGLGANISAFQKAELSYPSLYPIAREMGASGEYIERYLLWLVSLPFPSSLTGTSFSVSRDFSEEILGITYGQGGFYVLLPSWLGESFIAFGPYFALWGLIVGVLIGLMDRFLSKTPELLTYDAYLMALLFVYLRSVSQEYIAQAVASMWLLLFLYALSRLRREKTGASTTEEEISK